MDRLEAERHAIRGREIVAQQRDFVAKFGDGRPLAVALLKNFEGVAAYPPTAELPVESQEEANFRELARIMEILREGGYHVELENNLPLH